MNYDRLEALLKERKMSRRKLAQIIEISPNTLTSAINANSQTGKVNMPRTLKRIANALECNVYDLLTETEAEAWLYDEIRLVPVPENEKWNIKTNKELEEQMNWEAENPETVTYIHTGIDLKNRDIRQIFENVQKLNDAGVHELSKRSSEMTRLEEYKRMQEEEENHAP